MIERLIENWLTNANERGYEIPFCQLLMAEGHRVIHLNRHSPTEQGKDIITCDEKGRLCAFQLKGGDIDIGRWRREIKPEVDALVENIVEHPAVPSGFAIPYLVTNGRLTEPVVSQVMNLNRSNRRRRLKTLHVVVGTDLAARFVKCHGQFLPREPQNFEAFLHLFLSDGKDLLPKTRYCRFLESQLDPRRFSKETDIIRALASTVLLAAYALSGYQRNENHFANFEGWVLVAAHVARLAEAKKIAPKSWMASFRLVHGAARLALRNLTEEALSGRELVEGNAIMDGGPPYRARLTILFGLAAADGLCQSSGTDDHERSMRLNAMLEDNRHQMLLWGESAVPHFVCLALWLERRGRSAHAEGIVQMLIIAITALNNPRSIAGLPPPYYGVERCVAAQCRVAPHPIVHDNPRGTSFTLGPLIEFLVRRGRKQTLKSLWPEVTMIHLAEMEYLMPSDFYLWRVTDGQLSQRFVKRPQLWADLVAEVGMDDSSKLPKTLRADPEFALMFMLVYPHRFNRELLKLIERNIEVVASSGYSQVKEPRNATRPSRRDRKDRP